MMSLRRLWAVARKEFFHITRDRRTLFLVTLAPAFLLVTLSYVFSFNVDRADIAVRDLDNTALSRAFLRGITASGDLQIVAYVEREGEETPLFARDRADALLVIPHGFADRVLAGGPATVGCVVDGADAITASQILSLIEGVVDRWAADRVRLTSSLLPPGYCDVRTLAWYNPTFDALVSVVPGIMAILLCMPSLALVLALTREKEVGSFESLVVTPVRGTEYLLGKLLAYELSGMVSVILSWLVAVAWFHVPFRGRLTVFLSLAAVYLVAGMGISMLIANFIHNQQTAMFLILMVIFVPSFFISGLLLPVADKPVGRLVAYSLPTTHFIAISRGVFLKGLGVAALWPPVRSLLVMGAGNVALSLFLFRKKLT